MKYEIGKAEIRKLNITTDLSKQEVDISNIATAILIYEDIFAHYMTSNIQILDGVTLQNVLPIVGGETIDMDVGEFDDYSATIRKLKQEFVVFKMSSRQRVKQDLEAYELNLVTKEQLFDAGMSVEKSYNKPIHEIVSLVVQQFLTPISGKKLVTAELTEGIHSIVANNITPSAFIKQLMREAKSIENPASLYMFYETVEGYHFETIDQMYNRDPKHTFTWDELYISSATPGSQDILQNNIRYLNIDNSFDLLNGQLDGQFANDVYSFDPLTKTFKTKSYSYANNFKESAHSNKTLSNKIIDRYFKTSTQSRFIATNSHRSSVNYITSNEISTQNIFRRRQDFMSIERATMRQYGGMRIHCSIPGNTGVIAGQTVNIIIPSADDTVEGKLRNDRFISGKYIVTAVSHNIDATTGTYATVMECMRNGYEGRIY